MAEGERALLESPATFTPAGVALRPYTPDVLLEGGEMLELAGISFEVLPVPGHSPAHLAYHADGRLFSGDVLFAGSVGRTDLPGADWETLSASIRMLVDTLPAGNSRLPGPRPDHDARRGARAEPLPRGAPRGARRREPPVEDRAPARHARRRPRRAAALEARDVRDRAPLRALRLPADHDARSSRTPRSSSGRRAPARTSSRRRCTRSPTAPTAR